jgi:pimeloyl-ACP methyl ester carboxylesterase
VNHVRRVLWLAVAAALVACEAAGRQTTTPAVLQPCEIAGTTDSARCGSIRVNEAPNGRTIDLRVVVLPATTATPLPDPIVPLLGGPGQGAADLAGALAARYAAFRDQRDIVFIDQRGTGASNPLLCPQRTDTAELTGGIFDHARLVACRDQLAGHADLTRYTTTIAAQDYETVFDRLGYREVNLIGTSYGTRMGLELARQLPSRVRSLTLDAVVPMDFTWPATGAADADAALQRLIDDCAAAPACARRYPRFQQDVDLAFTRLRREPDTVAVRDPNTGSIAWVEFDQSDLAYATRGILYGNDALSLPLWFRQAAEGDFTAFAQAYVTRARSLDAQIATGVHFGVYCAEDLPFVDMAAARTAAAGTHLGAYLIDEYQRGCGVWPRATIPSSFRAPVESTVPALVMAGRRDPVTPPRTAIEVTRTLPRSRLIVWPAGGHGTDGLVSGDCKAGIIGEFVRTADPAAPSQECVTRDPVRQFTGAQ